MNKKELATVGLFTFQNLCIYECWTANFILGTHFSTDGRDYQFLVKIRYLPECKRVCIVQGFTRTAQSYLGLVTIFDTIGKIRLVCLLRGKRHRMGCPCSHSTFRASKNVSLTYARSQRSSSKSRRNLLQNSMLPLPQLLDSHASEVCQIFWGVSLQNSAVTLHGITVFGGSGGSNSTM